MSSAISPPSPSPSVAAAAERRWVMVTAALIAGLLGMLVFTGVHWATMPPSGIEPIDPTSLHVAGEFVEANLGTRTRPDGSLIVRFIGQQYSFNPQCIAVPADARITFRGTSADTVHGFLVTGTNANAMLVPGYITTFDTQFAHPGDHLMPCHEFCGTGHAAMWAHVKVLPAAEFERLVGAAGGSGVRCD